MTKKKYRKLKVAIIFIIFIYFLFVLFVKVTAKDDSIAIIGFHNVVSESDKNEYHSENMWVDSAVEFEDKMRYLYEQGYSSLTLDELYKWYNGEMDIPSKSTVLTFDDGYLASSQLIPDILKKYNFVGTTFVVGSTLEGEHSWDGSTIQFMNIKDMLDQSVMKYYSHTYAMHGKEEGEFLIDIKSKEEMVDDMNMQRQFVDTSYFAYPYGYYNDKIVSVLKGNGVKMAFGYHENRKARITDNLLTIPRFAITAYTNLETFKAMLGE